MPEIPPDDASVDAPDPLPSSRRRTRASGVFTRDTPGNRSLERGLAILRAFRPGITTLSNAELAQRTGLARPTVSRLTRTLVDGGFLEFDFASAAYRLGPPFLSFGQSVRQGSVVLQAALPLMRELADLLRINVGLAVADGADMIYLESVRKSRLGLFRHVVPGSRLPIAETALGRAWLAGLAPDARQASLAALSTRYGERWPAWLREIERALAHVARYGYCAATYQAGMVSIATPLVVPGQAVHAFNISFPVSTDGDRGGLERRYAPLLLETAGRLRGALTQAA